LKERKRNIVSPHRMRIWAERRRWEIRVGEDEEVRLS